MITQEKLRELIDYRDGKLYWKLAKAFNTEVGSEAGYKSIDGYIRIKIDRKGYLAHRIVWLYHYGYFPENSIDHTNRDKSDNRVENLREVSRQCNMRNRSQPCNNISSVVGVYWNKRDRKWQATIKVNRKTINLNCFSDFTEAVAHRLAAEQALDWSGCDSSSTSYKYIQNYLKENKHDA